MKKHPIILGLLAAGLVAWGFYVGSKKILGAAAAVAVAAMLAVLWAGLPWLWLVFPMFTMLQGLVVFVPGLSWLLPVTNLYPRSAAVKSASLSAAALSGLSSSDGQPAGAESLTTGP